MAEERPARGPNADRNCGSGLGRGVTPAAQQLIAPPCSQPEQEAVCRLHHEIDEDTPGAEITPPEWRWTESDRIDARIGVKDGAPFDHCRCTLQFTVLMLRDLLRRPVFVDHDDL